MMLLTLVESNVEARRRVAILRRSANLYPPPFGSVVFRVHIDVLTIKRSGSARGNKACNHITGEIRRRIS